MDHETNLLKSFRSVANRQAEFTQSITPDEPFFASDPGIVALLTACPALRYRNGGVTDRHAGEGGRLLMWHTARYPIKVKLVKGVLSQHSALLSAIHNQRCLLPGIVGSWNCARNGLGKSSRKIEIWGLFFGKESLRRSGRVKTHRYTSCLPRAQWS